MTFLQTRLLLLLLFPCVAVCFSGEMTYYMQKDKGVPTSSSAALVASHQTESTIECARLCTRNWNCFSFYAEFQRHASDAESPWTCKLFDARFTKNQIPDGVGFFGVAFGYIDEDKGRLPLGGAQFLFETFEEEYGDVVAVYDCSKINKSMTTTGIKYDQDVNGWPTLSAACQNSLCHQPSLAATILEITEKVDSEGDTYYLANTTCPSNDVHWDNAHCNDRGHWYSVKYSLGVACVASNCFRRNAAGKAVYNGQVNVTRSGVTCLTWSSHTSYYDPDDFPEDYADMEAASNFCRDPDNTGTLWCFAGSHDAWDQCDVTPCYWPFHI